MTLDIIGLTVRRAFVVFSMSAHVIPFEIIVQDVHILLASIADCHSDTSVCEKLEMLSDSGQNTVEHTLLCPYII